MPAATAAHDVRRRMSAPARLPKRRPRAAALPTHIGKYRVLGRLGDGATSEVFLGYDDFQRPQRRDQAGARRDRRRPGRRPLLASASSPPRRRWSAGCSIPNVVQIFDAVPDPVAPYLVMEYVAGSTLRPYCRADQLLSLELIVEIGFKCAMALGYVYRQGLIHRDVKPANLLAVLDQRHDHRRQDQRLRQRAEPRLGRDADPSRRLARLHVARAARRRHARLPRRHLLARRRALPPDRRPAARSTRRCSRRMMHQIYNVEPASLIGAARRRHARRSTT